MSEQETVQFFVDDEKVHHFGRETRVREVILVLLDGDEGHLFLGDSEEPLELDIIIGDLGIEKHGHLHAARCRHLEVTVEYAAKSRKHRFSPSATVKAVRDWAVAENWEPSIDPAERPKFALFLPDDSKDALPGTRRIGTYAPKGDCNVTFELAIRERPQG